MKKNYQLQTYIEEKSFCPLKYLKYINFLDLENLVHMNNLSNEDKDIVKNNLRIIICPKINVFLKENLPDLEFMLNYEV